MKEKNKEVKFYRLTMDEDELKQKVIDYLKENKMTKQDLAKDLGLAPTTIGNFLNGNRGLTPTVYKTLEEFYRLSKEERKLVVKKKKTIIQKWMIYNLRVYGNTVVCNITKRRTQKDVELEFEKLGIPVTVDENGIATLVQKMDVKNELG